MDKDLRREAIYLIAVGFVIACATMLGACWITNVAPLREVVAAPGTCLHFTGFGYELKPCK